MPHWTTIATILFAAAGALAVLVPAWLRVRATRDPEARPSRKRRNREPRVPLPAVSLHCPVCQAEISYARSELRSLAGTDVALIVAQRKEAINRNLAEAFCPRCEACLTFFDDVRPPILLGANIYHAQPSGNRCADCGKPLKRLPWKPDEYHTRSEVIDALDPLYGLDCELCGAVCCVACCENVSRNRSTDDTLMCPRCRRRPMEKLHHF